MILAIMSQLIITFVDERKEVVEDNCNDCIHWGQLCLEFSRKHQVRLDDIGQKADDEWDDNEKPDMQTERPEESQVSRLVSHRWHYGEQIAHERRVQALRDQ